MGRGWMYCSKPLILEFLILCVVVGTDHDSKSLMGVDTGCLALDL